MEFLDPKLDEYVVSRSENEPELLYELNRDTHMNVLIPRMLSGHLQGRVLSMLSHMIKPKNILEIGTYTGYSALCLAEGMQEGGKLVTMDINEELETRIKDYFNRSEHAGKFELHIGNAMEIIPTLDLDFDLVFIDADKTNYLNYYKMMIEKMKPGTYIVADNVLWSGKVLEDSSSMDPDTKALYEYSEFVKNDDRVQNVLFPIRDGLMISRKL